MRKLATVDPVKNSVLVLQPEILRHRSIPLTDDRVPTCTRIHHSRCRDDGIIARPVCVLKGCEGQCPSDPALFGLVRVGRRKVAPGYGSGGAQCKETGGSIKCSLGSKIDVL
eukprot:CAMPEP_0184356616 /NCGR_PEP_ID=MMETSP1089-20130417/103879_1 /TAXON_ID=38269 ORGANISM="Gloeochaete wittrockiana, Strain SAG46.84" /NCGR_SAMPLE_ID=MMETSP1089 /ASSEMBLY_ACC=CAM_ASM_000445 /LENGTH=111 /DNA_ID=CAMNT_0026693937 /DNA_START=117 /DNA_END=449 /DNA_ORIENTATION=-